MASYRKNKKKGNNVSIRFSLLTLLAGFILGVYLGPKVIDVVPQEILARFGVEKLNPAPEKKRVSKRQAKEERKTELEGDRYSLEIAVFRDIDSAAGLLDTLNTRGYSPHMETGIGSDGVLYKVRLGSWTSKEEARDFAKTFERKEEMKATVVQVK